MDHVPFASARDLENRRRLRVTLCLILRLAMGARNVLRAVDWVLARTGVPGVATLTVPLMVLTVGDARQAAAWTARILIAADIFAVTYWRRHTETRALLRLVPGRSDSR